MATCFFTSRNPRQSGGCAPANCPHALACHIPHLHGQSGQALHQALLFVHSLICASTQLVVGTRAAAVTALVAFAWLWDRCVGKIRSGLILCGAISAILLLPMIAAVRNVSGNDRSSASFLLDLVSRIDNPGTALVYEMGGSMGTIAHTLELVPSLRTYDDGSSYFYSGLAVLPNVFGDLSIQARLTAILQLGWWKMLIPLERPLALALGIRLLLKVTPTLVCSVLPL